MFYHHDILTDHKHGVATIWLVATLGSKSSLRKVTRKAIMDVDVPSACDTITDPSAPLALRLQGSLLFGVSKVFSQQCGYILTDTQNLRDKMRGITVLLKELEVDPNVATTRPEQLNLQIDPGFNVDLDLGFDLSSFDLHDSSTDEHSSLLSPQTSASSRTSFHDDTKFGLSEASPLRAFPSQGGAEDVNFDEDEFADERVEQHVVQPRDTLLNQAGAIAEDDEIEIREDGEMVFRTNTTLSGQAQEEMDQTFPPDAPVDNADLGLDIGDNEVPDQIDPPEQQDVEGNFSPDVEDYAVIAHQPLQNSSPTTQQPDANNVFNSVEEDAEDGEEPDAETIVLAHTAQQRNRPARTIPIDDPAELQNSTLGEWDTKYLQVMEDARTEHATKISVVQAKRNAAYWVLDQGIGGIDADFRADNEEHPLAMFSGEALLEMFARPETQMAGRKRSSSAVAEDEDRRVRPRSDDDQQVVVDNEDDLRSADEEAPTAVLDDDEDIPEPEMGRRQEVPLSDGIEFPWNSSRQASIRPPMSVAGVSSSAGRPAQFDFVPSSLGSKRVSRLVPESPLERLRLLRQSSVAHSAGRIDNEAENTFGEDDYDERFQLDETFQLDEQLAGGIQDADFETYGPAAPAFASTQQVADSQWLAATLEQEALNFLGFVTTAIDGKRTTEEEEVTVAFEELLPPDQNSHIVAAQGLLHVLSLATQGRIEVLQEEPFGSIEMGVAQRRTGIEIEAI